MTIDDQTRRRNTKTGLTALDRDRACPGYTLYAPMNGPGDVYLLNLDGEEVHHWAMPDPPGLYGYLLPNGNLFYGGKVRDGMWDRFQAWKRFKGGVMMEVDWDGNVVWEHRDIDHHHDARRTTSGGAIYLNVERVPEALAAKVKGGNPITGENGMWSDVIVEVDASGKRIWEWHATEHLDPERDIITFNDSRDEWSHGNTVVPISDDQVMFSFRNLSTVGIIEKSTGEIVWRLGGEVLAQQHDPSLLPNGNILVYDNGSHSGQHPLPFSRVVEVDPKSNQVVWQYLDSPAYNFFSAYISGARRLPNGNTLITEGQFGRMFQVTPEGDVVWEYINPHFHEDAENAVVNRVFRATHYLPEEISRLQ